MEEPRNEREKRQENITGPGKGKQENGRRTAFTKRPGPVVPPDNLREALSILKPTREKRKKVTDFVTSPQFRWGLGIAVGAVVLAAGLFLAVRLCINGAFRRQYDHGTYSYQPEQILTIVNIPEGYVPYYNCGNVAFEKEDYSKAVHYYTEALKKKPAHPEECSIRINLALAMLRQIDFEEAASADGATGGTEAVEEETLTAENDQVDQNKVKEILNQLYAARSVLTEENCADPDLLEEGESPDPDQYHSEQAEELKEEIDRLIRQLEQDSGISGSDEEDSDSDEQDSDNSGQDDRQQKTSREQQIEKKLNERQEEAQKEHNEAIASQSTEGTEDDSDGGDETGSGGVYQPAENW